MDVQYKKVDLFGGAIKVHVPSEFADVSQIRQVPDHQEVYLSSSGFSSLIFDLGERVSHTITDEDALRYHFEDTVDEKDTQKIWSLTSEGINLPHLPHAIRNRPATPVLFLLATTKPPLPTANSGPPRPNTATSVTILMALIRLLNQSTDIVVTLNIPRMSASDGADEVDEIGYDEDGRLRLGKAVQEGNRVMEEIWRTFEIKDWGLFAEG